MGNQNEKAYSGYHGVVFCNNEIVHKLHCIGNAYGGNDMIIGIDNNIPSATTNTKSFLYSSLDPRWINSKAHDLLEDKQQINEELQNEIHTTAIITGIGDTIHGNPCTFIPINHTEGFDPLFLYISNLHESEDVQLKIAVFDEDNKLVFTIQLVV